MISDRIWRRTTCAIPFALSFAFGKTRMAKHQLPQKLFACTCFVFVFFWGGIPMKGCGCGSKPMVSHFGVGAPPILVGILVGIGMFTGGGGTIWLLTHGHVSTLQVRQTSGMFWISAGHITGVCFGSSTRQQSDTS